MSDIKKKGLGRGLSALFGDSKIGDKKTNDLQSGQKALIGELRSNQFQPRGKFNDEKLIELSESIKQNGVIQPIAVRRDKSQQNKFEIIAGERRWLAAQRAGLHEVPINIMDLADNEALEVAIVENVQREDLNPIEEAKGYERLSNEFHYDQDQIAKLMSKSRSYISNSLRLLKLNLDIISMLEEGSLSAGQARPLIGLTNSSEIAEQIVLKKLSARAVESLAKERKNSSNKPSELDPDIKNMQNELENTLGLKVNINNKKNNSGKISIEYKNLEQFDLILRKLK